MLKRYFQKGKKPQLKPEEIAKRKIIEALNKGVDFYFAINPTTAIKWAVNENQYAIATALLKHEEKTRMRQLKEPLDWLKLLIPAGAFFLILCVGLYILITAVQNGGGAPNLSDGLGI